MKCYFFTFDQYSYSEVGTPLELSTSPDSMAYFLGTHFALGFAVYGVLPRNVQQSYYD